MTRYQLTTEAAADLFEIWCYIARDSVAAADRVEDEIHRAFAFLAEAPLHGHTREDLTARPLRFWTVQRYRNYVIVYDPGADPLQVIRILHGARDISREL